MKTLWKVGILMMSVFMAAGLAACSDDDDDDGGGGKGGQGTLSISGKNHSLNYCYYYDSSDGELIFSSFDWFTKNVPTTYTQFGIYFETHINQITEVTLRPDEYELELDIDMNIMDEDIPCPTFAWEPYPIYLNVKNPGNLHIKHTGDYIEVEIENLWMYGGMGVDSWNTDRLPDGYDWVSGSFRFSGPCIDVSSLVGE